MGGCDNERPDPFVRVRVRDPFACATPSCPDPFVPVRLEPGGIVRSLQRQYQHCMRRIGAEPFELGSDELNNLEYYHSFMSNGLAIRVLAVQR